MGAGRDAGDSWTGIGAALLTSQHSAQGKLGHVQRIESLSKVVGWLPLRLVEHRPIRIRRTLRSVGVPLSPPAHTEVLSAGTGSSPTRPASGENPNDLRIRIDAMDGHRT